MAIIRSHTKDLSINREAKLRQPEPRRGFRRLARDYERLPSSLAAYHWLAFVSLMLANLFPKG